MTILSRFTYVFLLLFFATITASGQGNVMRVELSAAQETDVYDLIPCDTFGIMILYETRDIIDAESKKWEFSFYDTLLNRKWIKEVPVLFGAEYQGYHYENETLYLLFVNTRKVKTSLNNFQVYTIPMPSGEPVGMSGTMGERSTPVGFVVLGNTAVVAVNNNKDIGEVYFLNTKSGDVVKTMIHVQDQTLIEYLYAHPNGGSVDISALTYTGKRQTGMVIFTLDLDGEIQSTLELINEVEGKYPVTSRLFRPGGDTLIAVGSYNTTQSRISTSDNYDINQSAGIYSTMFINGIQEELNLYNFLDFDNLRTGMSRKDYYKMQRRSHKTSSEYSLNYSLLVHDLDYQNENYILLLETFYPDYRTVSDITYDYWGRPIPQTYTVFEGYKYINAIAVGFDSSAHMIWDNSIEIYNISAYELGLKVDYIIDGPDLVFYYNEGGKITFKAVEKEMSLTGLVHAELENAHKGDKVMETGYDFMSPWYDDYYVCYGYQKIRNNSMVEKSRRTIFYFSKVAFE